MCQAQKFAGCSVLLNSILLSRIQDLMAFQQIIREMLLAAGLEAL